MVDTVTEAFKKFNANLEITGLQRSTVSARQQDIRAALDNGMEVLDSFLTGSYCRHTMIAPLSKADVDIFVVLDPSHYVVNGQKILLDELQKVIKKRYPNTPKISRNGQAVTVTFTDFIVDVVPAFNRQGGGYLIPNSNNNTWISTNPKYHVEYKSEHNTIHNGMLVPLIKNLKCWNRYNNGAFESFYLELMAIKIFKDVTISDYPSGIRYFFDKGREIIKYKIIDPAGYGEKINPLRDILTVDAAVTLFQEDYKNALNAERFSQLGKVESAITGWRKIFGDYFPVYSRSYTNVYS
jgi:hypothetical protein